MKNTRCLLAVVFFFGMIHQISAQNAYYDALILKDYSTLQANGILHLKITTKNVKELGKLFRNYGLSQDTLREKEISAEIEKLLRGNPFLETATTVQESDLSTKKIGLNKATISSLGGLDVTNIANAVADLMIERAKQELTIAFFDRFQTFAKENPEFGILFPKTTSNLKNLLSYTYPEMLPALRTGFLDDIQQITLRLDDVLDLPRYKELFKNLPEAKIAIRSLRLVHELETGASNAADIINEFSSFDEWTDQNSNDKIKEVGSILKIATFFSESIRSKDKEQVWIGGDTLKQIFYDKTLYSLYMGLLYQKASNNSTLVLYHFNQASQAYESLRVSELLKNQASNLFTFQNTLKEFFDLTGKVNVSFKDIKNKIGEKEKVSNNDYYAYISTSLDVVEYGFSLASLFNVDISKAEGYLILLRESNELYRNIYKKEYNQAIVNSLDIITKILQTVDKSKITAINGSIFIEGKSKSVKEGEVTITKGDTYKLTRNGITNEFKNLDSYVSSGSKIYFVSSSKENIHPLDKLFSFVEKFRPYALFMANVADADSDEDIKNALEAVILPVGSSSVKKYTLCNISVQSYLGAYWRTSPQPNYSNNAWSDQFGVTAPIGLSFTPGKLSWGKGGAVSLFVPIFDIGAIVDYKLVMDSAVSTATGKNESVVVKDYSIQLGQIISPGIFAVYGFGADLPLSLGFGAQYGPGLSKIDDANNTIVNNPSWRINAFLAVDLPFFNIINKSKHKQD